MFGCWGGSSFQNWTELSKMLKFNRFCSENIGRTTSRSQKTKAKNAKDKRFKLQLINIFHAHEKAECHGFDFLSTSSKSAIIFIFANQKLEAMT